MLSSSSSMNTDRQKLTLNDLDVEVIKKDIKNVHLSVYPPNGRIKVSAPISMNMDTLRVFVISKLGWIRQQQQKLREQERETPRDYIERESHYFWGKRFLLELIEKEAPPAVRLKHSAIRLQVRPGSSIEAREKLLDEWYRGQLKTAIDPLLARWQKKLGVQVSRVLVQRMKTKWGGCNPATRIIRLNLELAKKPQECLEYILVHELLHLLEPTHNTRFKSLLKQHMPQWSSHRELLNRLPVRHEHWRY